MPTYRITAPDGKKLKYTVPDGVTQEEVLAHAQSEWGDNNRGDGTVYDEKVQTVDLPASQAPGSDVLAPGTETWDRNADGSRKLIGQIATDTLGGIAHGIATPFDNAAGYLAGAFGQDAPRAAEAMTADLPTNGLGEFIGNVAATAPIPGGPLVQGAVGGALLSEAPTAAGVAFDAATGALGAKAGAAVMRGGAALAAPKLSEDLSTLGRAGVRTTLGQTARANGNKIGGWLEDRATSLPFTGDMIQADRVGANVSFNEATINRALEGIGEQLPKGLRAGRRAIRYAGDKLSEAYDNVLPRLNARADDELWGDLTAIADEAAVMLPERADQLSRILNNDVRRHFNADGSIDGRGLKAIETRLGDKIRRLSKSTDADQMELGDALSGVQAAIRGMAARQNPAEAAQLQGINQGWASLVQVERAALNGKDGVFGPRGYSSAVRSGNATTRSRGYARGEALNQDLSDAASNVLPSEVPDSGTSGRWAQSNLLALGLGAAAAPAYGVARGLNRALTREDYLAPRLAELLRYGAQAAPIAAPAAIQSLRD